MDLEIKKRLSIIIRKMHNQVIVKTSKIAQRFGLSPPQQYILFILYSTNEPLLMKEIGNLGGWERSTVTRLLKPLSEKQLIAVEKTKHGTKEVILQDEGRSIIQDVQKIMAEEKTFPFEMNHIPYQEIETFIDIALKLIGPHENEAFIQWFETPVM